MSFCHKIVKLYKTKNIVVHYVYFWCFFHFCLAGFINGFRKCCAQIMCYHIYIAPFNLLFMIFYIYRNIYQLFFNVDFLKDLKGLYQFLTTCKLNFIFCMKFMLFTKYCTGKMYFLFLSVHLCWIRRLRYFTTYLLVWKRTVSPNIVVIISS